MDPEVAKHQRQLDAMGEQIDGLQRQGESRAAARLRTLHQRVQGDFARLRQAFGDDWHRIHTDAEAGLRELDDELGAVDSKMVGWHDEEVMTLDRSLDEVTRELERMHADDLASTQRRLAVDESGIAELRAQIAEARKRRQAIASTPATGQRAAVDSYSAAVQRVVKSWRKP